MEFVKAGDPQQPNERVRAGPLHRDSPASADDSAGFCRTSEQSPVLRDFSVARVTWVSACGHLFEFKELAIVEATLLSFLQHNLLLRTAVE